MYRLWVETVRGWKIQNEYDTLAVAIAALKACRGRAYVVDMSCGCMGGMVKQNW